MSTEFKIAETDSFSKKIKKAEFKAVYNKITNYIYPQLKKNPFYGPNIKKLKGKFSDIYRYRTGQYRLFYTVDTEIIVVFIIDISHRKESYKKK